MLLNRRAMLSTSVGAIALGLSGCAHTKTTVIFVNHYILPLSIDATAGGKNFNKKNVQPGHSAQQVYLTNTPLGTLAPVSGTITPKGQAPVNLAIYNAALTVGYKNTITVSSAGALTITVQ